MAEEHTLTQRQRFEHGFLRVRCDSCHAKHRVAFSWPLLRIFAPAALVIPFTSQTPRLGSQLRGAENAALLADEVLSEQPMRQWALSFPYPLRFLFGSRPVIMGRVLGSVYRVVVTHLIKKAGFSGKTAQAGAVTPIQRFGSALNLSKQS